MEIIFSLTLSDVSEHPLPFWHIKTHQRKSYVEDSWKMRLAGCWLHCRLGRVQKLLKICTIKPRISHYPCFSLNLRIYFKKIPRFSHHFNLVTVFLNPKGVTKSRFDSIIIFQNAYEVEKCRVPRNMNIFLQKLKSISFKKGAKKS